MFVIIYYLIKFNEMEERIEYYKRLFRALSCLLGALCMLIVINLVFTYKVSAIFSFFFLLVLIGLLIYGILGFMRGSFHFFKSR